jgi:hypothetical protein
MSDRELVQEIVRLLEELLSRWSMGKFTFWKLFKYNKVKELRTTLKGEVLHG